MNDKEICDSSLQSIYFYISYKMNILHSVQILNNDNSHITNIFLFMTSSIKTRYTFITQNWNWDLLIHVSSSALECFMFHVTQVQGTTTSMWHKVHTNSFMFHATQSVNSRHLSFRNTSCEEGGQSAELLSKNFPENFLKFFPNPVTLVFIWKLSLSTFKWISMWQGSNNHSAFYKIFFGAKSPWAVRGLKDIRKVMKNTNQIC